MRVPRPGARRLRLLALLAALLAVSGAALRYEVSTSALGVPTGKPICLLHIQSQLPPPLWELQRGAGCSDCAVKKSLKGVSGSDV